MKNKDNKSYVLEQKHVTVRPYLLTFVHVSRNRVEIGPYEIPQVRIWSLVLRPQNIYI